MPIWHNVEFHDLYPSPLQVLHIKFGQDWFSSFYIYSIVLHAT